MLRELEIVDIRLTRHRIEVVILRLIRTSRRVVVTLEAVHSDLVAYLARHDESEPTGIRLAHCRVALHLWVAAACAVALESACDCLARCRKLAKHASELTPQTLGM